MSIRWALNTYRTGDDLPLEELIDLAARTGYEGIEFLMDFDQPHGVEADAATDHLRHVRKLMADAGLVISGVTSCAHFHELDPEKLAENQRRARQTLDVAEELGCPYVRVLGDRPPFDENRERVLDQIVENLRHLGEAAAPKGQTVSMEMHSGTTDPAVSVPIIERVDLPNVGLIFNGQFHNPPARPPEWGVPTGASIRPLYDRFRPHLRSIHVHAMEPADVLPQYAELFRLLKSDDWSGWVSQEAAYTGPDKEKVLALYTGLFHSLTRA